MNTQSQYDISEIKELAWDAIKRFYFVAEREFGRSFPLPTVEFKNLRGTAGLAYYTRNHLEFDITFFKEETRDMLEDTVPHEIGHLLQHILYPKAKRSHGPEWKYVCHKLGMKEVKRCHNYDASNVPNSRRNFNVYCDCGSFGVGKNLFAKITTSNKKYCCRKCKKNLSANPYPPVMDVTGIDFDF